jgi:hypothetical protein
MFYIPGGRAVEVHGEGRDFGAGTVNHDLGGGINTDGVSLGAKSPCRWLTCKVRGADYLNLLASHCVLIESFHA